MAVAGAELALVVVRAGGALLRLHAVALGAQAHEAADRVVALAVAAQVCHLHDTIKVLYVLSISVS